MKPLRMLHQISNFASGRSGFLSWVTNSLGTTVQWQQEIMKINNNDNEALNIMNDVYDDTTR
jgi:hypothetical protein